MLFTIKPNGTRKKNIEPIRSKYEHHNHNYVKIITRESKGLSTTKIYFHDIFTYSPEQNFNVFPPLKTLASLFHQNTYTHLLPTNDVTSYLSGKIEETKEMLLYLPTTRSAALPGSVHTVSECPSIMLDDGRLLLPLSTLPLVL